MNNMNNRPDRRVTKTKAAILNAFLRLLAEKDIDNISIKDIANAADINRKTFYCHYKGIYQVIDDFENEIVSEFDNILNDLDFNQVFENPIIIFSRLNTVICSNIEAYTNLAVKNKNSNLTLKVISKVSEKIKLSFKNQIPLDNYRTTLIFDFALSGMLTIYYNWIISDQQQPIEELSKVVSTLCSSGINGVLNASSDDLNKKSDVPI